jgi:hypothetical protein
VGYQEMTTTSPDIRLSDDVLRQLHENIADVFQSTDIADVSTILDTIKQTIEYTQNPAKYYEPITMTADQAAAYGLEVPEGWTLQTQINESGDVSFSMVDPDGWQIDDSGNYTAPDGTQFTQAELEETMNVQDVIDRNIEPILSGISEVIGAADWPAEMRAADVTGETILSWALQSPENSQAFMQGLWNVGARGFNVKTGKENIPDADAQQLIDDSFTALQYLGYTDEDLQQMFPAYATQISEEKRAQLGLGGKIQDWLWQNIVCRVGRGIESVINFITASGEQRVAELVAKFGGSEQDRVYIENINRLYDMYGWTSCFTDEAQQVYANWHAPGGGWGKFAISLVNPIWLLSGTAVFKGAERVVALSEVFSKVPALTEITQTTARLVQFVEAAPGRVIGLPFKGAGAASRWFSGVSIKGNLAIAGAERAAGEAFARDISDLAIRPAVQDWARTVIPEPKNVLVRLPTYDELAPQMFAESPARRFALTAIKTPGVGRLIEKAYRFTPNAKLIAGTTAAWSKVSGEIGKISLYTQTLYGMGKGTAGQAVSILKAISGKSSPIKFWGLDKYGISKTIRTAAGHAGEARTIYRILENPTAYKLSPEQIKYASVIYSTIDDIYKMQLREGIVVQKTAVADLEHYVHRVVKNVNRNAGLGMKGRIGRLPTFVKHRTVGEVTEEVAKKIAYTHNPEVIVESYVQQGIKRIADKRMAELVQKLPDVRVSLENPVYKDFKSALGSASRGATIKPEIINRIEQEFPDLGRRFRAATRMATVEDEAVRGYLQKSWDQIKDLQQRLAAKEAAPATEAKAAGEVAAPSIETFTKTMEAIAYDDRLLFLDTFEARMVEIDRMAGEMSQEIEGMKNFLEQDVVASYRGTMGKRTTSLLSLLDKSGKFPETLTPKQAELLLMGRELKPNVLTAEGRVRWEYVMDELADHFHMTEREFINHLENLKATRLRITDLKGLIDDAVVRKTELQGMRDAVNAVNRRAANLPTSEEGRPIWATEKPLPTEEELLRPPVGSVEYKPVSSILDEIPPVVRTSAERKAELEAIRANLEKMTHPTAKLGEQQLFHPAFRGWALPPEIARTVNYFWDSRSNSFLEFTAKVAGLLRTKAAMDFSAMMIQALPAMGATMATLNPKYMTTWLKGLGEGLEVWLKPEVYAKWAAEHNVAIQQRISFGGTQMSFDWFEATPWLLSWSEHVPGASWVVRQTYGRFEAQFSFSLDYMRQTTWEALSPAAIKSGNAFKLAEMCDHMIGVTSREIAGVPAWFRDIESSFGWFAPNYTHGCLQLVGDIFRGKYMAGQAVKALAGMMGACTLVYYTYCKATGQEPQLNPFARGFMTSTVDGFDVRLGGFWNGQARLLIDIWNSAHDNWDTPIDFFWITKEGALNRENPFLMWWYKRSSALTHFGIDTMWQHRDYNQHELDDPLSYAKYMLECITPIATDAMLQNVLWGDKQAGWKIFLAELFGLNTYPSSLYKALADQAAIYINQMQPSEIEPDQMQKWQKGELTWDDLNKAQQATLKLRYPELNDMENAADEAQDQWATPLRRDYWNAIDNIRTYKIDTGNALVDDLMSGVDSAGNAFNTKSFRNAVSDMNTAYGIMYGGVNNDERFAEIIAGWDRQKDPKDAETVDAAYDEYFDTVVGGDYDGPDDIFNFNAYDKAIADFKTKWGIDIYNQILTILESNKMGENPVVVRLWKDRQTLAASGYWDMPVDTTEQRAARNDFLKANPTIDATLFFWGYRSDLETVAAYNNVVQMCQDTGIPYTAVGGTGKLPPTSVAPDWLSYKEQELTGWDRQNYLRDHQTLYEWGMANLGWDAIDFSTVPNPEMKRMLDEYDAAAVGDARLRLRCMNQELDNWMVNIEGYSAAYGTDRCTKLGY